MRDKLGSQQIEIKCEFQHWQELDWSTWPRSTDIVDLSDFISESDQLTALGMEGQLPASLKGQALKHIIESNGVLINLLKNIYL